MKIIQFKSDIDVECSICFDHINYNDNVGILPCHHYFCYDCISRWNSIDNICPICRNSNNEIPLNLINNDVVLLMINDYNSKLSELVLNLNLNFNSLGNNYIKVVIKDIYECITITYPWSFINSNNIQIKLPTIINLSCISIYLKYDNYNYKFHLEYDIYNIIQHQNIINIDVNLQQNNNFHVKFKDNYITYGTRHNRYCHSCNNDSGIWLPNYFSDSCDEIYIHECDPLDCCTIL